MRVRHTQKSRKITRINEEEDTEGGKGLRRAGSEVSVCTVHLCRLPR